MSSDSTPRSSRPPAQAIEDLIERMSLPEKLGQLSQLPYRAKDGDEVLAMVARGEVGSFLNADSLDVRNQLQRVAVEETRLGIPLIFGRDVIHGFKTIFPIPLGQAASFNPDLVARAASVAAREAAATGVDWTFAPMLDVGRDPRWGRVAETCGEDPYLTSQLGAAMVRGFQGRDVADGQHVAACAKHFVGYGASEAGRDYNTTFIPERLLRDVHLPPFKAAVDAGVLTVMSAFNDLNGIPASANAFILRSVLREEWGFTGFVVSDWAAVLELLSHGLVAHPQDAAHEAITAGLDMEMATTTFREHLEALVALGRVPVERIDEAVRRILSVKFALNLFRAPYRKPAIESVELIDAHRTLARELAQQSVVLLKNEGGLLPLVRPTSVALSGPLADSAIDQMGCWSLDGDVSACVTLRAALSQRLAGRLNFAPGLSSCRSLDESGFQAACSLANNAEVCVVCVGEDAKLSGESKSRACLGLPGAQLALLERLSETGTPLVVVCLSGRPLILERLCQLAQAVLFAGHPGTMAGPALVDLLLGQVAPSGKLPMSLPRAEGQIPVYYAHRQTGRPPRAKRASVPTGTPLDPVDFDSSYIDLDVTPLFPFGFGLSYTEFAYSSLSVSPARVPLATPRVTVSVLVENCGSHVGTETVQVYIRDLVSSVTRPLRELKAFRRVSLEPGQQVNVSFELDADALSFSGRDMRPTLEAGVFEVFVGGDSNASLCGRFELSGV